MKDMKRLKENPLPLHTALPFLFFMLFMVKRLLRSSTSAHSSPLPVLHGEEIAEKLCLCTQLPSSCSSCSSW